MNQLITIHIGGAGSNIGSKLWYNLSQHRQEDLSSIFQENSHQSYKPRSIFVNTIDDQVPKYHEPQFSSNQFFYTKEETGNIYTVGHYCRTKLEGKQKIVIAFLDFYLQIKSFQIYYTHSISGGFGSGYTTLLSSLLKTQYQKSISFSFCLMPSPNYSNNVIESYNSIMSLNSMVEAFDGVILLQNEAIYQIIENQLDIEFPSYNEVNQVITHPIMSLLKFNQQQSLQMLKLNLWNNNKLNIWSCSFGPLINYDQKRISKKITLNSLKDIISQNSYICNKKKPNYKQAFLYAEQINQTVLSKTLSELVENKQYSIYQSGQEEGQIKQCKEQFQQINTQKENMVFINKSTGVAEQLNQLHKNAQILYQKRAFMHWYVGIGIEDQSIRWEFSSFEEMQNNYANDVSNNE